MKLLKSKSALFAILISLLIMPFVYGCSEETVDNSTEYSMGFSVVNSSAEEMDKIAQAYKEAIGVTAERFTLDGKQADNDAKVKAGCSAAQEKLKSITFAGYYEYTVKRGLNVLHTASYGTKK